MHLKNGSKEASTNDVQSYHSDTRRTGAFAGYLSCVTIRPSHSAMKHPACFTLTVSPTQEFGLGVAVSAP